MLPHGELERLADNLYTVEGKLRMPLGETSRRMTVVRLQGNRLAIYSAIALDDARMAKLESLGAPAFLIVPNALHRIDARPWQRRYPYIEVIAPHGAADKVSKVVPIDANQADFGDARVTLEPVLGTDQRELAMMVETETGKTLVINDLIFNLPPRKGLMGFGMRVLGFGPGHPTIPRAVKRKLIADEWEVKTQLRDWAGLDGLERIVVSHGAPIENPRETLLELAGEA
ncbi:MAG TPA: hypothetical protein VFV99_04840 [Kofleriaceae bacterium]|nr:hypothetical protein [Kofleriaceae bacterium]